MRTQKVPYMVNDIDGAARNAAHEIPKGPAGADEFLVDQIGDDMVNGSNEFR